MKFLAISTLVKLAILLTPLFCQPASADVLVGKITGITKTNSLWLNTHEEKGVQVILAFLSIPHSGQPYSERASKILQAQLLNREVSVTVLRREQNYLVGLVYVGTKNFNLELLSRGHAWLDYHQPAHPSWLKHQLAAMASGIGLFSDPNAVHPIQWHQDKKGSEIAVSALEKLTAFGSSKGFDSLFVGNRKTMVYVDISCTSTWSRWHSTRAVPLLTVAGAEDSGFIYEECGRSQSDRYAVPTTSGDADEQSN